MYAGVAGEGWQPWDYAAGWLFIEEAGGVVTQVKTHGDHCLSSLGDKHFGRPWCLS